MSKNVSIAEGRTARTFGDVAKLKTNVPGGGSTYWVPEEEVQLESLDVNKNGTYTAAGAGVYGFNSVEVALPLTTKEITQNGTYRASSDSVEGWDVVKVNVASGGGNTGDGVDGGGGESSRETDSPITSFDTGGGNTNDYVVKPDPNTGDPTLVKVPKKILFTTVHLTYKQGDPFNHAHYVVSAVWDSNGTEQRTNITSQCGFSLPDGYTLTDDIVLAASWTYSGVTYTAKCTVPVAEDTTTIKKIMFTKIKLDYKDGDLLDYDDYTVVACYDNEGHITTDVTSSCRFGIAENTVLREGTYLFSASYTAPNGQTFTTATQIPVSQGETQEIQNLNNWTANAFSGLSIGYANGSNSFTYKFVSGNYEKFILAVDVEQGKNYTFLMNFSASAYTESNRSGTHTYMVVTRSMPLNKYVEDWGSIVLGKTRIFPGVGQYSVSFNSAQWTRVYLVIDLCAVTDGETDSFTISNLTFAETD